MATWHMQLLAACKRGTAQQSSTVPNTAQAALPGRGMPKGALQCCAAVRCCPNFLGSALHWCSALLCLLGAAASQHSLCLGNNYAAAGVDMTHPCKAAVAPSLTMPTIAKQLCCSL